MQVRRSRAGSWVAFVSFVSLCVVACGTPTKMPEDTTPALVQEPGPDFSGPLTWQKLEQMEDWLETPQSQRSPDARTEIELQLYEGRVTFAQRDAERANVPPDALRVRLESARDGFRLLIARNTLMTRQNVRAQIGLRASETLLAKLAKPAATKQPLVIIDRSRWGAVQANPSRLTPLKGSWSRITVHHSDEESSDAKGGSLDDSSHTLRLIQKFHMEDAQHRWGDIGYHFLIDAGGRIFEGRELKWQGAHAGGKDGANNTQNVGICMLGNFLHRAPTPAALKSLELLLEDLRTKYKIPTSRLFYHNEFTGTECPGPFLTDWVKKHR